MKRRLFGILLALTMLLSCFVGMMMGAEAEASNKIVFAVGDLTVEELGVEGAIYAEDIMGALSILDENSRKHASDLVAEIHFKGNTTGGDQGNLLFAQKTIWREDGTKLPISIIGHDTAEPRDAYIYLDGIGGWYTCANDYSFENLTLPVGDQETYFYAGSGNVRLDNVKLLSSGEMTVASVADRTAFYQNAKAAALSVCEDAAGLIKPDVSRLPAGDAWQKVRTSEEYMATGTVLVDKDGVSYVDKDLTGSNGSLYGDYGHAGNTGGGQYLNACVYYEAILGLDCRENDWTPTKYELDPDLQKMLQEAAHAAVLEVYGEDHFKNPIPYERQGDGVVNLLMMGSSSSYYMRDELHFMAEHIGIKFRVVHAYSSGIKMSTQWAWTRDGNGKWSVYTEWDGQTAEKKEQKMTDFVELYPWDAIVTYETGGSFNKKNLKVEGYNEASIAKAIAYCDKTDEFINYVYDFNANNANARYFWFQTVGSPVGAPGPSDSAEGFLFADNNTSAAYVGWTEADIERYSENGKIVSSLTLGESITFGSRANAVGYMLTAPETPFTDETASQVEFIHLNGFESDVEVRPVNTLGKLILDADTAAISSSPIKRGYSPASAELYIKRGSGKSIVAYGSSAKGLTKYGDITFRWTGGTIEEIDLISGSNITGDLNVIIDLPQGNKTSVTMIRTAFNGNVITGDVNVYAKNLTVVGSVHLGGGAEGVVTNSFENCNITENFFGVRSGKSGKIINNIKNTTIGGLYCGGHWSGDSSVVGPIVNNIDGLTLSGTGNDSLAGIYYGGSYNGGGKTKANVTEGLVEIDGKNETLSIYNHIKSIELAGSFYGGSRDGTCGNIRNDIDGLTAVNYYGAGAESSVAGNVANNIKNATLTGSFYGGAASIGANATKNITTDAQNISVTTAFYGGNAQTNVNGTISTTLRSGEITGYYFGGNSVGQSMAIQNTVYGGMTVKGNWYGGNETDGAGAITNTFHGGSFEKNVYGGSYKGTVGGNITNTIYGMTLSGTYGGAGRAGTVNGTVTNNVYGGTIPTFNGGFLPAASGTTTVKGDILNTVKGDVKITKTFSGATLESTANRKSVIEGTIVNLFEADEKGKTPVIGSPASDSTSFGYYGGGHHAVPKSGVVNIIKAGTFKKIWQGGVFYLGTGTLGIVPAEHLPEGVEKNKFSVVNLFLGGSFVETQDNRNYVWSGINGTNSGYSGSCLMAGGIYTCVDGANFDVRLYAGNRSYATNENQPLVTLIKSGTFKSTVCFAGSHLGDNTGAKVHTSSATVEGGTFNGEIFVGQKNGALVQNASLTVKGGTFNGDVYVSYTSALSEGAYTLTLEPTVDDITLATAVAAQLQGETLILKGGDKRIKLVSDATITASSYDGVALKLHREEGWAKGEIYLTLPTADANANITATKGDGKKGDLKMVADGSESKWIGIDSASVYGVNLILDSKIELRVWLNKAEIDAIGNDFTISITREGYDKAVFAGTYADLVAKAEVMTQKIDGVDTEFYTLVLPGTSPSDYEMKYTICGMGLNLTELSMNDLLRIVIDDQAGIFTEGFKTLAKAIWNYGIEGYDRFSGATSALTPETLSAPAAAEIVASGKAGTSEKITLVGKALVLREAVGIRYYLNLAEGVTAEDLTVSMFGEALDAALINFAEEEGNGYNASVTLYVAAGYMDLALTVDFAAPDGDAGSYTESIASLCQQYVNAGRADAELCSALLRYVQAIPEMNS